MNLYLNLDTSVAESKAFIVVLLKFEVYAHCELCRRPRSESVAEVSADFGSFSSNTIHVLRSSSGCVNRFIKIHSEFYSMPYVILVVAIEGLKIV